MKNAENTYITEVMLVDWLQKYFVPENSQLRIKAQDDGVIILLINWHARTLLRASSPMEVSNKQFLSGPWHSCPASAGLWISAPFPCSRSSVKEIKNT
jgi:hypothetical protein